MAIHTACPHCETSYNLPDEKSGKTVRCKECKETFKVENGKSNGKLVGKSKTQVAEKTQVRAPQRKVNARDDDEEDEDRPAKAKKGKKDDDDDGKKKKKKKKDQGGGGLIWIAAGGGGLLLVGLVVGLVVWMMGEAEPEDPGKKPAPIAKAPGDKKDKDGKKHPGKKDKDGKINPEDEKPPEPKFIEPTEKLAEDDDVYINYKKLEKDAVLHLGDVKSAVEWFHKADPKKLRDMSGLVEGYKDHPWRSKVSRALELLLHKADFLSDRVYWEAYSAWVTPDHWEQIKIHMERAPKSEYRAMLMRRMAEFRTVEVVEYLADLLASPQSSEKDLAYQLLEEMGGKLCLKTIFPYRWHPKNEVQKAADRLIQGYGLDIQHPLYTGPLLPLNVMDRLPKLPKGEYLTLDSVSGVLSAPAKESKGGWKTPERFRQLMALDWLQRQQVSAKQMDAISAALDKLITLDDFPVRTNALICLEIWFTKGNIATLKKMFESSEFRSDKVKVFTLLKNMKDAETVVIGFWPELPGDFQDGMHEYILAVSTPQGKKMVLQKCFNHALGHIRATSREAVQKWQIDREIVLEQCVNDGVGNDKEKSQIAALGWLKTQEQPLDGKKRAELLKKLEALLLSKDPKLADRISAAAAVNQKWGNLTPATLVAILESPEFAEMRWEQERHLAMDKLTALRPPPDAAVAAIAYRYKHIRDKDKVVVSFNKLNINPGPMWVDARLSDAYDLAESKEKKIELLKVMAAFGATPQLYNQLERHLSAVPPPDPDLAKELKDTRANMKQRLPK